MKPTHTTDQLESIEEQRRVNAHSQRMYLIIADSATTAEEREIARERAFRCERRLVLLDRLLRA